MEKLDELLLMSGNDIPFSRARVTIHPPKLREIAYIGEETFHRGSHMLAFDRNRLADKDKIDLEDKSDFEIFMSVMNSRSSSAKAKTDSLMVLALLFPEHKFRIEHDKILLQLENFSSSINEQNFDDFRDILSQIFCLDVSEEGQYNPADALAARIAEKIKKAKAAKAAKKGEDITKKTIYSRYVSILSVGLHISINELMNYTVYQLRDEITRYQLKISNDLDIQIKLAGGKKESEEDKQKNWMDDIHP